LGLPLGNSLTAFLIGSILSFLEINESLLWLQANGRENLFIFHVNINIASFLLPKRRGLFYVGSFFGLFLD